MNKIFFEILSFIWLFFFRLKRSFITPKAKEIQSKSLLVSEACNIVTKVLDDVLTKQSDPLRHICNPREDESVVYDLYNLAVSYLEKKFGVATYKGIGGGSTFCTVARPNQIDPHDYSHSIQMAWWVINDDFFYILLTGHDADTLLCFTAHYVYTA